jgi:hypothetical protein
VDEGDADAAQDVEELGEAQRRRDVALRWEREEHGVRAGCHLPGGGVDPLETKIFSLTIWRE